MRSVIRKFVGGALCGGASLEGRTVTLNWGEVQVYSALVIVRRCTVLARPAIINTDAQGRMRRKLKNMS